MPMSEEEQAACCLLGGCGCRPLRKRAQALAKMTGMSQEAAEKLLREYVLIPRAALDLDDDTIQGGAAGL